MVFKEQTLGFTVRVEDGDESNTHFRVKSTALDGPACKGGVGVGGILLKINERGIEGKMLKEFKKIVAIETKGMETKRKMPPLVIEFRRMGREGGAGRKRVDVQYK